MNREHSSVDRGTLDSDTAMLPRPSHVGVWRRTKWKMEAVKTRPHCVYCGCRVGIGHEFGAFEATVDHVQPLAKSGLDREDNWALACRICNQSKGAGKFTPEKRRALILKRALRTNARG